METMIFLSVQNDAALVILENGIVKCRILNDGNKWTIGRASMNNNPNIQLNTEIVGRKHAEIIRIGNDWFYVDKGSINGTYHNGKKIEKGINGSFSPVSLNNGDILRIDSKDLNHPDSRGIWMMFTTDRIEEKWVNYSLDKKDTVIGRCSKDCDIVIDLPYISEQHCKITYVKGKYYIYDCNSLAGTWVNNNRINSPLILNEKDKISLCDRHFIFTGNSIIYNPVKKFDTSSANKSVMLKADIISKKVNNSNGKGKKELIKNIHLEICQGSLVALLGGSGAGKTTIMNCLNGMDTEGVQGTILFNGEDLQKNFNRLKLRIGSVPQENVLHKMLTVERELMDAAESRLPRGVTKKECKKRVDLIIKQLGLEKQRNTQIAKCSGGEQSRVNIGIDLVADKALFCLDEPDKGLDPQSKRELFTVLRDLAHDEGKSILVIIHDVSEIDMFDQLIMMAKVDNVGRLAFSGSPAEAKKYFGAEIKEAYELLKDNPEKYVR
ncbi:MAG: FHA domain-containing protein [Butyrivibrio sp.]